MKLYTAQYKYAGDDRLDITVKGKDPIGRCFAPTWKMVMGSISWDEYKQMYRELMQKSYQGKLSAWNDILGRDEVTLVCFCASGTNCHRYLLAGYLEKLGAEYMGERV
ncbi:MAG: DUF488 family protein [Desulfobacter postgatei]|uniref:DUF488 family protein, N3 subclade n=1 Tax=Desulfobacter postgatei TaxID=2293 RepID=UPI0023F3BCE8|nr:DUF488 family protein [Desulfobacter postgatei]MDD4274017.1 DUF488 family protein [Desulfobacter postgatei]